MRHFDYITRPAKLLTLEIVLFVLFIASSIMFSGCNTKTDAQTEILLNSKETLPINIQIGEKPISLLEGNTIPQPLAAIKQKRIILFVVACAIMHLITVSTYHSIGN